LESFGNAIHKRGIATHETIGKFRGICIDGSIQVQGIEPEIYSAPGDSGALIFLNIDGELYPFGIHFASDDSGFSYAIPIYKILDDILSKQKYDKISIKFINPKITSINYEKDDLQNII
jgi:hypothetical protein